MKDTRYAGYPTHPRHRRRAPFVASLSPPVAAESPFSGGGIYPPGTFPTSATRPPPRCPRPRSAASARPSCAASVEPAGRSRPAAHRVRRSLGRRLAAANNAGGSYTFFLIDDPVINAFAGPAGYIGVYAGLILAAQTESELAAVMAHEIAHVTQRHLMRSFEDQGKLTIPTRRCWSPPRSSGPFRGRSRWRRSPGARPP